MIETYSQKQERLRLEEKKRREERERQSYVNRYNDPVYDNSTPTFPTIETNSWEPSNSSYDPSPSTSDTSDYGGFGGGESGGAGSTDSW